MNPYQSLLRRVFTTLPTEERQLFLQELWTSLTPDERNMLLRAVESSEATIEQTAVEKTTPVEVQLEALPKETQTTEPSTSLEEAPKPNAKPLETQVPMTAEQRIAVVEQQFETFAAGQDVRSTVRTQFLGCAGIVLLAAGVIVAMSIGGGELYGWIVSLFSPQN